jgi:hypothetical protein
MKNGDQVRVYPHGCEKLAAVGRIAIISKNERSIAVGFEDSPPFAISPGGGMAIHPRFGVMLFATREVLNGQPWGPWVELIGGGHYEIEAQ